MTVSRLPSPVHSAIIVANMGWTINVHDGAREKLWSKPDVGFCDIRSPGEAEMCAAAMSELTDLPLARLVRGRPPANSVTILSGARA